MVTVLSTIFAEPLEIIGLWLGTTGIFSGAAATWSYLTYGCDAEMAGAAQRGAAIGFIVGCCVAFVSALYLWL